MRYRRLGRTGFQVSEIGYGAWGIGGTQWLGGDDRESSGWPCATAIELGLNFIDTALAYGDGHSEQLVGQVVREAGSQDLRRLEGAAQEHALAGAAGHPHRGGFSVRIHHAVDRAQPEEPRARDHRPAAVARMEPGMDRQRRMAARVRGPEALRKSASRRHFHQRSPARQRARHHRDRPDRHRAGDLQHLRPDAGEESVSAGHGERHRRDCARARWTKARSPARSTSTRNSSPRIFARDISRATAKSRWRSAWPLSQRDLRHSRRRHARGGAALLPLASGGLERDSRHADARQCGVQLLHSRQRAAAGEGGGDSEESTPGSGISTARDSEWVRILRRSLCFRRS